MNEVSFSQFEDDHIKAIGKDFAAETSSLYALSNSLRQVLVPVRALEFKESLRGRIDKKPLVRSRLKNLVHSQNIAWILVAAAGSLLSLAGVLLLIIRRIRTAGKAQQTAATVSI